MSRNSLLSGRDRELQEMAEQYEEAMAERKPFYLDADDLADLADWYGAKKKFDKGIEVAEYGMRLHPEHPGLMIENAYLHLDSGQKEKAFEIIRSLPEIYSPEAKVLQSHLLMSEGKLDEAEQLLNTIEDKKDLTNVIEVSYMYLGMGYPDKAMEWLEPVKDEYAEEETYIAAMADYYYSQRMYREAKTQYNKLIDINPYSPFYWIGLGRCHFEAGDFGQTIDACDYALVSDDEFAEAYILKGHSFYQLGNEEAALECYRKAEELNALSPEFLYSYIGLCKVARGEWKESYENLKKAIQASETDDSLSPVLPGLYANAGLCLSMMGKKRAAHQHCQKAHTLAPEEAESFLIEGRIYLEEGNFEKCIKLWAKALDNSPTPDTWNEIGIHSMELGYLNYAKTAFEHVCELDPDFDDINERLTVTYMMLHDKENFMKYNLKCPHPFNLEDLEKIQTLMENENQEELAVYMQNIIQALK